MDNTRLIRKLGFISTVVIPVLTLAVTSALAYLKENENSKNNKLNPGVEQEKKEIDNKS